MCGLDDYSRLIVRHEVSAVHFDEPSISGSAGQIHLQVMPGDGESVLVVARLADKALTFEDYEGDVEMPLQMRADIELATGSQRAIPIEPAILGCVTRYFAISPTTRTIPAV